MLRRGWTAEQIDEAVKNGSRIDAVNRSNGVPATRFVSPQSGASVVIDNTTKEVIQVGEPDFIHSPASGDLPGAVMRPPPGGGPQLETPVGPRGALGTPPLEPIAPTEPFDLNIPAFEPL